MIGFRCPHCKQQTIGAWQKLKSNGWKPKTCIHCGGQYVPLVWSSLLPVVIFGCGLLAGLHDAAFMSAAALVSLIAAAGLYLFTPLLKYRSTAARWDLATFVAALAAVGVYAALRTDPRTPAEEAVIIRGPTAWYFSDPKVREEYKAMLERRNIPFRLEMRDGKEFILVDDPPK